MTQLKALKSDAKREVGNKFPIMGSFDELIRLQERIESGTLTRNERINEMKQFKEVALDLAETLEREGAYDLSERVFDVASFGPRDGFNMPDAQLENFHEVANRFLG